MPFNSLSFWIFFSVFLIVYKKVPLRIQNALLLFASFAMMSLWNPWLPVVILALASIIFILAQRIQRSQRKRSDLLWAASALVFGMLFVLRLLRLQMPGPERVPDQLTPNSVAFTGVSVISLQLLGYLISVYRSQVLPSREPFRFMLFATFFPIAQMGPIERFEHLYPQFANRNEATDWVRGFNLIALGLTKKLAVADPLSGFVFSATPSLNLLGGSALWIYSLVSFIQVYADFSGYVDIARGIAVLLNFEVAQNFIQPYLARNVGDVWRRWNITLMSWFNDFIYLPMILRTKSLYLSAAVVMVFSAMWHGLSWRFALWGIYWTLAYWVYLFYRIRTRRQKRETTWGPALGALLSIGATLLVTSLSTLVFMSGSLEEYLHVWMRALTFSLSDLSSLSARAEKTSLQALPVFASCAIVLFSETLMLNFKRAPLWLLYVLLFALAAFASEQSHHFIYLRY